MGLPKASPCRPYLEHFDFPHDRDAHSLVPFARFAPDQLQGDEASVTAAVSRGGSRVTGLGSYLLESLAFPSESNARERAFAERTLDDKVAETVAVLQLRSGVLRFWLVHGRWWSTLLLATLPGRTDAASRFLSRRVETAIRSVVQVDKASSYRRSDW